MGYLYLPYQLVSRISEPSTVAFMKFNNFTRMINVFVCLLHVKNTRNKQTAVSDVDTEAGKPHFFYLFFINPTKTNMEPENGPLEKEIPIGNHHFQVPC